MDLSGQKKSTNTKEGVSWFNRLYNSFVYLKDEFTLPQHPEPKTPQAASVVRRAQKMWADMTPFEKEVATIMNGGKEPAFVKMKVGDSAPPAKKAK